MPKTVEIIIDLMNKNGLNAHQLEVGAELSNASIQAWSNGRAKPSIDALIKLARYFNVSADYLLGLTDERRPLSVTEVVQPQTAIAEKGYSEVAENFICEFKEQMKEKAFQDIAKLYKAIKDASLKAQILTVLVAYLNRNGINTESIVGY